MARFRGQRTEGWTASMLLLSTQVDIRTFTDPDFNPGNSLRGQCRTTSVIHRRHGVDPLAEDAALAGAVPIYGDLQVFQRFALLVRITLIEGIK